MKKTIILAAMLALPTFAGQKVIVNQAPVAPVAPAVASPWALEIGATYAWGVQDIYKGEEWSPCKEIKTIGADLTGVYNLDDNNAVTLRFGYNWGGEKWADGYYYNDNQRSAVGCWNKTRQHTFYLMPGYRYTHHITDSLSAFVGVNVGIANVSNKYNEYGEDDGETWKSPTLHNAKWGFAYSAELGLRYDINQTLYVFGAYQFSGNTAKPNLKYEGETYCKAKANHYHGVRVGLGVNF